MGRILKPLVRGGGWYPSKKWIPLVKNGGYTTQNGGDNVNWAKVSGVSPLSLPNALAHFINSLRQIGKCTVSGTDITCNNGVLKYDPELGIYADGTPEEIRVTASGAEDQTATASNLFAVGSVKDEQDIISGTITRRCEAVVSDGTTPSGRYIGTVGEGNILVCAKETGYSGAIASFTADKAEPLSGLVAQINPVQDLHGQDAPYPPEGKGNLYPFQDKTATSNGVTAVFSGNHIKVTGTGTASGGRLNLVSANFALKAGTYYYKRFNVSLGGQQQTALYVQDGTNLVSPINDGTFTLSEDSSTINIGMNVESGKTYNYEFDIMLVSGSTEPSAFYPYSNICPISGWTGLSGQRTGFNVWDEEYKSGYYSIDDGRFVEVPDRICVKNPVEVKPSTKYFFVTPSTGLWVLQYDKDGNYLGVYDFVNNTYLTMQPNTAQIKFYALPNYGATYNHDISINYPSTDTSYHAYQGEAISVTFPSTVYGGSDEVVGGNGASTMGMVDFSDLSWSLASATYGRWYAVIDGIKPPADGATPLNAIAEEYKIVTSNAYNNVVGTMYCVPNGTTINVCNGSATDKPTGKLCYELATPTTFTHEGQSVDTLIGQNNVFVDTGNVTAYIPDFTTEQVAGQSLSTTEGTNTVFVTSNVDPVEIEVEYAVAPEE